MNHYRYTIDNHLEVVAASRMEAEPKAQAIAQRFNLTITYKEEVHASEPEVGRITGDQGHPG